MDNLIGKAAGKFFGGDDERPAGLGGGNVTHGGAYPPAPGGNPQGEDLDLHHAASIAAKEAPDNQDFFAGILGKLLDDKPKAQIAEEDIDEEDAVQSHRQFFGLGGGAAAPASSSSLGNAAAMQALKMFTSGGGDSSQQHGQSQNAFVGLAMAQAAKLFDSQASQGNVQSGADKESVVMKAGEMALKMYMKQGGAGGGGGGGAAGLMGLASKFL